MSLSDSIGRAAGLAAAATLSVGILAAPADAAPVPHPSAAIANETPTILGTSGGD